MFCFPVVAAAYLGQCSLDAEIEVGGDNRLDAPCARKLCDAPMHAVGARRVQHAQNLDIKWAKNKRKKNKLYIKKEAGGTKSANGKWGQKYNKQMLNNERSAREQMGGPTLK